MSYDFTFMRVARQLAPFPCAIPKDFGEPDTHAFTNLDELAELLVGSGFRPNGPAEMRSYWWDTPDGGSLDISINQHWINVDTHAHWRFVLRVFDFLHERYPDLAIFDPQRGLFHDRDSYLRCSDESYRELARTKIGT